MDEPIPTNRDDSTMRVADRWTSNATKTIETVSPRSIVRRIDVSVRANQPPSRLCFRLTVYCLHEISRYLNRLVIAVSKERRGTIHDRCASFGLCLHRGYV